MTKATEKKHLWAILDQEEIALGLCLAKTAGGALHLYEETTGHDRAGLRAEVLQFEAGCALLPGVR